MQWVTRMNVDKIWLAIGDWRLWALCAVACSFGAAGGFLRAISRTAADPSPPRWAQVLIGALAAVAVLYVNEPDSALALIGGSLVAGYVGQAALDALEARFQLKQARDDADGARKELAGTRKELTITTDERDKAAAAAQLALGEAAEPGLLDASALGKVFAPGAAPPAGDRIGRAKELLRSLRRGPTTTSA